MRKENVDVLQEIMVSVLELQGDIKFSKLKKEEIASWDSMAIVNLVVAVESDLGVKISNEELEKFSSYESIISILTKKGL